MSVNWLWGNVTLVTVTVTAITNAVAHPVVKVLHRHRNIKVGA